MPIPSSRSPNPVHYHQLIRANASGFSASNQRFFKASAVLRLRENMRGNIRFLLLTAVVVATCSATSAAGDLKIRLPKRSKETPVQQLNREGVKQVEKHNIGKAKKLFYKAYLLAPNNPFTQNNLGYVSKLEGDVK